MGFAEGGVFCWVRVTRFEFRRLLFISLPFCFAKWWIYMYCSRDAAMLIGQVEGFPARFHPFDLLMRKALKRRAGVAYI